MASTRRSFRVAGALFGRICRAGSFGQLVRPDRFALTAPKVSLYLVGLDCPRIRFCHDDGSHHGAIASRRGVVAQPGVTPTVFCIGPRWTTSSLNGALPMHRRQYTVTRSLAAVACAAALAACSGGGGGSTGNKSGAAPPQDVQSAVAASVASSVTSQITAMTTTGVDPFLALFNRVSTGRTPVVSLSRLMKLKRGTHGLQFGADCPTIAPSPIVDTDADGVPDSVSETYGNDCSESSNGSTLTVTGSVSIRRRPRRTSRITRTSTISRSRNPEGPTRFRSPSTGRWESVRR